MSGRGSRHHAKLDRKRWTLVRIQTFERDGWRCCTCGKAGRLECDHIVPLHRGGNPYDPANLQTLCVGCHVAKSRAERERPDPGREAWLALIAEIIQQ